MAEWATNVLPTDTALIQRSLDIYYNYGVIGDAAFEKDVCDFAKRVANLVSK